MNWKLEDRDAEDAIARHYDDLYYSTDFAKSMFSDFCNCVRKRVRDGQVLDLGSGTGIVADLLRPYHLEVFCADFSINMLRVAGTRCEHVVQADAEALPLADSTFDAVYVHSVLHHFPDFGRVMLESMRVLKCGGYLIIQEPNSHNIRCDWFLRALERLSHRLGVTNYNDFSHLEVRQTANHRPISLSEITDQMVEAGFEIEERRNRYYSSYALSVLRSRLAHRVGRFFDAYYERKARDGYMILVVARKPETKIGI